MDEQIINTENTQAYWNQVTPVSKYLSMALFIALPFVGLWIGTTLNLANSSPVSISSEVNESKEIKQDNKFTSENEQLDRNLIGMEYRNTKYGFVLHVPEVWGEIGYVIKEIDGQNIDQKMIIFSLLGLDPDTGETSPFRFSLISIYPLVSYVRETCADKELCVPGEEIGRNNEYVFVSEYYSPEAFGECYVSGTEQLGGSFYVDNMKLCNERGISSYIEKQEKHFSTFDVSNK